MTAADVARLLGRAAFGATAADLDAWTGKPYADLVERLLDVPPVEGRWTDEPQRLALQTRVETTAREAQSWWLERMRTTPWPLLERMTLFWHGHFATAVNYELGLLPNLMLLQNQTLRRNALGNFRTLVEEITVDPAMLLWLNGNINRPPQPNENYAREVFELFALGKRPQVYTEKDLREAARALTGWSCANGVSSFTAAGHDKGRKNILGTVVDDLGDQEYKKVVEIALKEPVAPRFIAEKLVGNFAYSSAIPNLLGSRDKLVNAVASTLRTSSWNIEAAVRTMLLSDEFRYAAPHAGRQLVRQPVEAVVAATKALGVPLGGNDAQVLAALTQMGQTLFEPPNVGGWPKGTRWISPMSTLARYELGIAMWDRAWQTTEAKVTAFPASGDMAGWAKRFGLAGLSANTVQEIRGYLARRKGGAGEPEMQQGVVALVFCSPDWVVI